MLKKVRMAVPKVMKTIHLYGLGRNNKQHAYIYHPVQYSLHMLLLLPNPRFLDFRHYHCIHTTFNIFTYTCRYINSSTAAAATIKRTVIPYASATTKMPTYRDDQKHIPASLPMSLPQVHSRDEAITTGQSTLKNIYLLLQSTI